jgi:hypothetical protein
LLYWFSFGRKASPNHMKDSLRTAVVFMWVLA